MTGLGAAAKVRGVLRTTLKIRLAVALLVATLGLSRSAAAQETGGLNALGQAVRESNEVQEALAALGDGGVIDGGGRPASEGLVTPVGPALHGLATPAPAVDGGSEPTDAGLAAESAVAPTDGGEPELEQGDGGLADAGARFSGTVTARRGLDTRRVAGSAHAIREEQLAMQEHDDVQRVVAQVPGVYVRNEDGFGLRPNIGLRGAASDRSAKVTLMQDGVLFAPAPYSDPQAYYFPLTTRMVGIEVFKGPASIRFGPSTVGGAIDLLSRPVPEEGWKGGLDLGLGTYRTGKAHGFAGWGGEWFAGQAELVHLESTGFKHLPGGQDTGFAKNEGRLTLQARLPAPTGAKQRLTAMGGYADERSNETYTGVSDSDFAKDPLGRYAATQNDQMNWKRSEFELRHLLAFESGLRLETVAYRHDLHRTWFKLDGLGAGVPLPDVLADGERSGLGSLLEVLRGTRDTSGPDDTLLFLNNDRHFVAQGVQSALRLKLDTGPIRHELELGARAHHDEVNRVHTLTTWAMQRGTPVRDTAPSEIEIDNLGYTRALALHLHDELSFGSVALVPGLRFERISTAFFDNRSGFHQAQVQNVVLPGIGIVGEPLAGLVLLGGVHQGFSAVSPGQPVGTLPEKSWSYEAGARFRRKQLRAELIGFVNDYFNLTGQCSLSQGCSEQLVGRQFNGGKVLVAGFEAAAGWSHLLPHGVTVSVDGNYTLTTSRFRSSFESDAPQFGSVKEGDALPYVPVHQGSARLGGAWWRLRGELSLLGTSEMREVAGQGAIPEAVRIPPSALLDFAAHLATGESHEAYVTLHNLTNQTPLASRKPYGARPIAPFSAMVGWKMSFE